MTTKVSAYRKPSALVAMVFLGLIGVGILALAYWRWSAEDPQWWAWLVSFGVWVLLAGIFVVRIPSIQEARSQPRDPDRERRSGMLSILLGAVLTLCGILTLVLNMPREDVSMVIVGSVQALAGIGIAGSGGRAIVQAGRRD